MLRTGVDIIELERLRVAIARHGQRFLQRVYTPAELTHCADRLESLAGRFAAKEAVAKALGTGIWRNGIRWTDIEILRDPENGAPLLTLHHTAARHAQSLNLQEWSISLSHTHTQAVAFVVAQNSR